MSGEQEVDSSVLRRDIFSGAKYSHFAKSESNRTVGVTAQNGGNQDLLYKYFFLTVRHGVERVETSILSKDVFKSLFKQSGSSDAVLLHTRAEGAGLNVAVSTRQCDATTASCLHTSFKAGLVAGHGDSA